MAADGARPAIKFCGLTRAEDAMRAVELGASYVGVIFASGPRLLSESRAAQVLADVPREVKRVGVFGDQPAAEIAPIAKRLALGAVQLHGATDPARVDEVRRSVNVEVWPVIRIAGGALPATAIEIAASSDVLFLDSFVEGALGGSGVAFAWDELAVKIQVLREGKRVVLAGGLRPENIARAIAAISPDVVDVSSGVESAPGIKDHDRMRRFRDAAMLTSVSK